MVDISRSAATEAELDAEFESGGRSWPALTAFTDFGFRKSTAQHVVPLLYGLVIAGAVVLYPAGAVVAFELSAVLGVFWLSTIPLTSGLVATFFGTTWMSMLFGIVFLSHQVGSFTGVQIGFCT